MRAAISTIALMALALASAAGVAAPTAGAPGSICRAVSPPYTVALVELYTSQGCSSCPPADRWLSKLQGGPAPLRAVPLALHVGYWDYIGWKDPFARREFNDRQRRLATHNGSGTVYTPEVFVGASELADWGSPNRVAAALAAVNARPPQASIELQAHWVAATAGSVPAAQQLAVQVHWSADRSARDPQLLLAVKRGGYLTDVQAGENRGEQLRNDHVVRAWGGPYGPARQPLATELTVPYAPGDAALVAIAQDGASGAVLQAVELSLAACEAPADPAAAIRPKASAQ
jgi:hypothetical protein